jgi:hypothetical protein
MARLYSNENFPLPTAEELRRLGHDVLTIQDASQSNEAMSDESVLAFAHSTSRALLTLNRKHFIRLHRQNNRPFRDNCLQVRSRLPGVGTANSYGVKSRLDHAVAT